MNPFVEECSREWKRLGVPDPIANEMAADLEIDLAEAEADGTSAEDVLGVEVFDPPAFARSWAADRGVIPEPPAGARIALAVAALVSGGGHGRRLLVAIFGASCSRRATGADGASDGGRPGARPISD